MGQLYGQLGNDNSNDQATPIQIIDSGVSQVAAGSYHTLFKRRWLSLGHGIQLYGELGNDNSIIKQLIQLLIQAFLKLPQVITIPSS